MESSPMASSKTGKQFYWGGEVQMAREEEEEEIEEESKERVFVME